MSRRVSAGFIVFRQLGRNPIEYLLLQTSNGEYHWTPPKGKMSQYADWKKNKETYYLDKSEVCSGFKVHSSLLGKDKRLYILLIDQ